MWARPTTATTVCPWSRRSPFVMYMFRLSSITCSISGAYLRATCVRRRANTRGGALEKSSSAHCLASAMASASMANRGPTEKSVRLKRSNAGWKSREISAWSISPAMISALVSDAARIAVVMSPPIIATKGPTFSSASSTMPAGMRLRSMGFPSRNPWIAFMYCVSLESPGGRCFRVCIRLAQSSRKTVSGRTFSMTPCTSCLLCSAMCVVPIK
mmetsp:Transcript_6642/g.18760  ORF Transcript_6642/g.18760 Transcript_6642/m.18760 type:complete len:214 (+) Transcript_6642:1034-1675(+)